VAARLRDITEVSGYHKFQSAVSPQFRSHGALHRSSSPRFRSYAVNMQSYLAEPHSMDPIDDAYIIFAVLGPTGWTVMQMGPHAEGLAYRYFYVIDIRYIKLHYQFSHWHSNTHYSEHALYLGSDFRVWGVDTILPRRTALRYDKPMGKITVHSWGFHLWYRPLRGHKALSLVNTRTLQLLCLFRCLCVPVWVLVSTKPTCLCVNHVPVD